MSEYSAWINLKECPLDLGFARWVKLTWNLGFRFFVVRPNRYGVEHLIECPGYLQGVSRHGDLGPNVNQPGYKEAKVLVHRLGEVSTHVYTLLMGEVAPNRHVHYDRDWPCSCISPNQPVFQPITR
jgi:hypothetical protein